MLNHHTYQSRLAKHKTTRALPSLASKFLIVATSGILASAGALVARDIEPLTESTLREIINDVKILQGEDLEAIVAEQSMVLRAPDFLETGRRSRVRMEAEDGTITRIGSNTLFSFDQTSRTVNLNKGSLLFHSPEGRGGGRIITASATASVLGTTIITVATPDGGFKILVLEGRARVDFLDGTSRILGPGQMTFVLPSESEDDGDEKVGEPGPVLNFNLSRLASASNLLNGFNVPLPSQPKILEAIREQVAKIKEGALEESDALILSADEETVVLMEGKTLIENITEIQRRNDEADGDPGGGDPGEGEIPLTEEERFLLALQTDADISRDGFDSELFFPFPGFIPPPGLLDSEVFPEDFHAFGFVARNIGFSGGSHDISPITFDTLGQQLDLFFYDLSAEELSGADLALMLAPGLISFSNENIITGFETDTVVLMGSASGFSFANDSALFLENSTSAFSYSLELILTTDGGFETGAGSRISNPYGSIELESVGPMTLSGSIEAGGLVDPGTLGQASSELRSTLSSVVGNIFISSFDDISLRGADIDATGWVDVSTTETITITGFDGFQPNEESSYGSNLYGAAVYIAGDSGVNISDSYIATGTSSVSKGEFFGQGVYIESLLNTVELGEGTTVESDFIQISGGSGVRISGATLDSEAGSYYRVESGYPSAQEYSYDGIFIGTTGGDIVIENGSSLLGESISIDSGGGDITIVGGNSLTAFNDISLIAGNTVRVDAADISADFIEIRGHDVEMTGQETLSHMSASELLLVADTMAEFSSIDLSGLLQVNIEGQTLYFEDVIFPGHGNVWLTSESGQLNLVDLENGRRVGDVNFMRGTVWVDGREGNAENYVSSAAGGFAETPSDVLININASSLE